MGDKVKFEITDGKLIIQVDPNEDGQIVLEVKIDLLEVPDEVLSALKKD